MEVKITVVNKTELSDRPGEYRAYIGRPSPLGNPFKMKKEGDRDSVVEKYREWLWSRILDHDLSVIGELSTLMGRLRKGQALNLVCWCAPKPCHGDVLKSCLKWAAKEVPASLPGIYAGIGSRKTPPEVLKQMEYIGHLLGERGWLLRSGGAKGADSAFERGCDRAQGKKQITTPRSNNHCLQEAWGLAAQSVMIEPHWQSLAHSRNVAIIAGRSLLLPADIVITWTPDGKKAGGTGSAIRYAESRGCEVVNLAIPGSYKRIIRDFAICQDEEFEQAFQKRGIATGS